MSTRDKKLIAAIFDELIPPRSDAGLSGAGRPEIVEYAEERLADGGQAAMMFDGVLFAVDYRAKEEHGAPFPELEREQRVAVLKAVEQTNELFIPVLLLFAYTGYYHQPDVMAALGLESRPPFPSGNEVLVSDDALLKQVRERWGRPE